MLINENKFIRTKKQRKKFLSIILIIFLLLVFIGIFLFSNTSSKIQYSKQGLTAIHGIVKEENNYPLYTHTIIDNNNKNYIKSSTINLNSITDKKVVLFGEKIEEHVNKSIFDIKIVGHEEGKYFQRENQYIFPKKFFILDLDQDHNLTIKNTKNKIQVAYNNNISFGIQSFLCSNILEKQNCKKIKKKLINKFVKTFKSPLGYDFYQYSDKYWYVLEENSPIGYIFHITDEETLANLSYIFQPIDTKYITTHKKSIIHNKCLLKNNQKIKSFLSSTGNISDNTLFKISLTLETYLHKKNKKVNCDILLDISDSNFWID